jgi:hypothetical protein
MLLNWIRYFAISASLANIIAASVLLLVMLFTTPAWADEGLFDNHDWWVGAGPGADINGDYVAAIISGGLFPRTRDLSYGFRSYLEAGRYNYREGSGNAVTIGLEPIITWRGFYFGAGLSLGNTTPNLGTVWNFSGTGGYRFKITEKWSGDCSATHRSHASRLGIASDKANGGVTVVNCQGIFSF